MMKFDRYEWVAIAIMISLFIIVGFIQGWSVSLVILNMCIISAIMTMGVNISWGYAGVINFEVKASWVDLLQLVLITVIGAYFGGRSIEKVKK